MLFFFSFFMSFFDSFKKYFVFIDSPRIWSNVSDTEMKEHIYVPYTQNRITLRKSRQARKQTKCHNFYKGVISRMQFGTLEEL